MSNGPGVFTTGPGRNVEETRTTEHGSRNIENGKRHDAHTIEKKENMNHTQKFAELDKLVGGLKEVTGLSEKERNKTPQHKKWKSALNALPKKDQQEYRQQKYDEAVKDKKKRHQDLKELCEHTK